MLAPARKRSANKSLHRWTIHKRNSNLTLYHHSTGAIDRQREHVLRRHSGQPYGTSILRIVRQLRRVVYAQRAFVLSQSKQCAASSIPHHINRMIILLFIIRLRDIVQQCSASSVFFEWIFFCSFLFVICGVVLDSSMVWPQYIQTHIQYMLAYLILFLSI